MATGGGPVKRFLAAAGNYFESGGHSYGGAAKFLWGGGGAWYSDNLPSTASLDAVFANPPDPITWIPGGTGILSDHAICQLFGLHACGYEGGYDLGGGGGGLVYYTMGADSDSRATTDEEYTLGQYYQSAGPNSLPVIFLAVNSAEGIKVGGY